MNVDISTHNGVTSLSIIGSSAKDISALTDVFGRKPIERVFKFNARAKNVIKRNGAVCSVVLNNDAYITTRYLKSIGFTAYRHLSQSPNSGGLPEYRGYFFVKGYVVLYRRKGSNVYIAYSNAHLTCPDDMRCGSWSVIQRNGNIPAKRDAHFRFVSELDDYYSKNK